MGAEGLTLLPPRVGLDLPGLVTHDRASNAAARRPGYNAAEGDAEMNCDACIPRERILTVCEWARARIAEMGREKDSATLRAEVDRKNRLRRLVRMRKLGDAEVHEALSMTGSYPWRSWREREVSELLSLARDAEGGVRVKGRDWCELLKWCAENGWEDERRPG